MKFIFKNSLVNTCLNLFTIRSHEHCRKPWPIDSMSQSGISWQRSCCTLSRLTIINKSYLSSGREIPISNQDQEFKKKKSKIRGMITLIIIIRKQSKVLLYSCKLYVRAYTNQTSLSKK